MYRWGGLNLSAQLVMQLASGILVDRYGRRLGLYAMTGLVALVSNRFAQHKTVS